MSLYDVYIYMCIYICHTKSRTNARYRLHTDLCELAALHKGRELDRHDELTACTQLVN